MSGAKSYEPFLCVERAELATSIEIGIRGAEPNGHSQADFPRPVGAPNRLEERVQSLCDGPGVEPEQAKAVQDLAEYVRVAAL
jgi:hypothetical protein